MRARDFAIPAFRFLREEARSLTVLGLPVLGIALVAALAGGLGAGPLTALSAIGDLVSFVALIQFSRVVYGGLADGRAPAPGELARLDAATWSLLWRTMAIGAIAMVPSLAGFLLTELLAAAGWLAIPVGMGCSFFLAARLSLVPPLAVAPSLAGGVATGPIGASWALTRGQAWLCFKLLLLTAAPFLLLAILLSGPILGALIGDSPGPIGLGARLAFGLGSTALNLASAAVFGHALVALCRQLTAAAAAAPHSAPGGPSA